MSAPKTTPYVALLRGINVGSAKQVAMADLRDLLTGLGLTDVRTHLRSGNALFRASGSATTAQRRLGGAVEDAISQRLGMTVGVVIRSRAELAAAVKANPFVQPGRDAARLFAVFCSGPVPADALSSVDLDSHRPDEVAVSPTGRDLYLWLPGGMGTSKLGGLRWDRLTGQVATARNWRTTVTLLDMLDD